MSESPTQPPPSSQERSVELTLRARQLLQDGRTPQEIRNLMMKAGLSREEAETLVDKLGKSESRGTRQRAIASLITGGVVCAAGIIGSIASYMNARTEGGGFQIAVGAIILGGILLVFSVGYLINGE